MLVRSLADRILDVEFDRLPLAALDTAKLAILDTVGVTLAGSREETTRVVARTLRRTAAAGPALVFGDTQRLDVLSATLINGVAAHALDFDDCSNTLGGHPSAPILPALWTLAPGVTGKAFIAAYAAGVECETKLARAVNFHHYEKGWHPTATLGTFGSAAACGHLLGLSRDELATALALAASMASGIKANFGTMTKPFHIGQAARNGLCAALLAQEGMTASLDALEHAQGFFAVYNGAGTIEPDRIFDAWADPYDLADPGVAFKRHPCCASTHSAADAMLHLRETHGLSHHQVTKIEAWTHPRRLAHVNRPDPTSGLEGKFSIQYVLARALMHGIVSVEHFSDAAARDATARAVTARVSAAGDPDASLVTTDHFYARVHLTTAGGETYRHFVDLPLGRDQNHPLPSGTIEGKFRDCAGMVLDTDSSEALLCRCRELENVTNLAEVLNLIEAGAASRPAASRPAADLLAERDRACA
jgi:2-methylcitrate dehydratase PrpD